jgi:hypothetical protein
VEAGAYAFYVSEGGLGSFDYVSFFFSSSHNSPGLPLLTYLFLSWPYVPECAVLPPLPLSFPRSSLARDQLTPIFRALYIPPDPYITSDAVFGVKTSLIVPMGTVSPQQAKEYGVPEGTALLKHDFVLVTEETTRGLRDKNALEALSKLFPGTKCKLLDHLPVPDLD